MPGWGGLGSCRHHNQQHQHNQQHRRDTKLQAHYRSGRSRDWLKSKNPASAAVRREVTEDWGKR